MKMLQNFANDARRACEYTRDRVSNGKLPYQNTPLGEGSVKNGMLPPLEVSCATLANNEDQKKTNISLYDTSRI